MISNISVLICNCFRTKRANSSKNVFKGVPLLTPSFERKPLTQGNKILSQKTKVIVVTYSKNFVILVCTVLIQIKSVTEEQTDRH